MGAALLHLFLLGFALTLPLSAGAHFAIPHSREEWIAYGIALAITAVLVGGIILLVRLVSQKK